MNEALAFYSDADRLFADPVCITWIRGVAVEDVLREFGADPEQAIEATWAQVYAAAWGDDDDNGAEADGDDGEDYDGLSGVLLAAAHDGGVVVVEPLSCLGTDSALLRDLTAAGGEALSLYWTINLQVSVTSAVGGRIVATFDPLELFAASGDDPDAVSEWLRSLPVTETQWREDWMAVAFALGERLSGIRVHRDWLARPHLLSRTAPHSRRPELFLDARMRALVAADPRVAAIAAQPDHDKLPEIIRIAAEMAVRSTGIRGDVVDKAMNLITTGERGTRGRALDAELALMADQLLKQAQAAHQRDARGAPFNPGHDTVFGRLLLERQAVEALRGALYSDPETASSKALDGAAATQLSHDNGDDIRYRTLTAIRHFIVHGENWL
ncbi:hypothetical protein IMZ11_25325 [Microtetraspora sp. AC03309]|uniref:DUF6461 domain-containing protein n=1 Tax=Microtetraspora sp. AC03309 TaxID=2779376 RepID=UPI001E4E1332|nr:DUF6461 domain-containing protein [Microtetraspora sp. AC03309]MCC5578952.1 hypothetical protein [Microtetraspora sp. AC03309]